MNALLTNLLGYGGPTIVKPALCVEPSLWVWILGGSGEVLYCLVEVPLSCLASIRALGLCDVRRGRLDSRE